MFFNNNLFKRGGRMYESWALAHGAIPQDINYARRSVHDVCIDLKHWISSRSGYFSRRLSLSTSSKLVNGAVRIYNLQLDDLLNDAKRLLDENISAGELSTSHKSSNDYNYPQSESFENIMGLCPSDEQQKYMPLPSNFDENNERVTGNEKYFDNENKNEYVSQCNKISMTYNYFCELLANDDKRIVLKGKVRKRRSHTILIKRTVDQGWRRKRMATLKALSVPGRALGGTLGAVWARHVPPASRTAREAPLDRDLFLLSPQPSVENDDTMTEDQEMRQYETLDHNLDDSFNLSLKIQNELSINKAFSPSEALQHTNIILTPSQLDPSASDIRDISSTNVSSYFENSCSNVSKEATPDLLIGVTCVFRNKTSLRPIKVLKYNVDGKYIPM